MTPAATADAPILLIEDSPADAELLAAMLDGPGRRSVRVVAVRTLSEARDALAVEVPECILLDLGLPDADGFEALMEMRRRAPDAPIVIQTGREDEAFGIEAVKRGAQDYLVKGRFDEELLLRAIRYAVERRRFERQNDLLREKLHQNERLEAVGRLAGGVAHDFNNLLTVILNGTAFVADRLEEGHPSSEDLDEILQAARRAAALSQQLLAFGENGLRPPEELELGGLLERLRPRLDGDLAGRCTLRILTGDRPVRIRAVAPAVEAAVLILARRASDAGPSGGQVSVTVDVVEDSGDLFHHQLASGSYAQLAVSQAASASDNAANGAPQPFLTRTPVRVGTGMDLAVVEGATRQAGGALRLDFAPGGGATVELLFPLVGESSEAAGARSDPLGNVPTVLVVEDREAIRDLMVHILARHGFSVLRAGSIREALSICEREEPRVDLILSDVDVPPHSGQELAWHVHERWPELPITYVSGRGGAEIAVAAPILERPFTSEALVRYVSTALGSPSEGGIGGA